MTCSGEVTLSPPEVYLAAAVSPAAAGTLAAAGPLNDNQQGTKLRITQISLKLLPISIELRREGFCIKIPASQH